MKIFFIIFAVANACNMIGKVYVQQIQIQKNQYQSDQSDIAQIFFFLHKTYWIQVLTNDIVVLLSWVTCLKEGYQTAKSDKHCGEWDNQ